MTHQKGQERPAKGNVVPDRPGVHVAPEITVLSTRDTSIAYFCLFVFLALFSEGC